MDKIYTLLGFAQKAGKVRTGEEVIAGAIGKKSAALLLVAHDSPDDIKRKMAALGKARIIPVYLWADKATIGIAIGKSPRNAVLVMDRQMAVEMLNHIDTKEGLFKNETEIWGCADDKNQSI